MLFIDNPVGCGFSFTNDPNGFVTNEKEVGEDLFTFITLFFQAFPEYQESDFFVAGESYGGKVRRLQVQLLAGSDFDLLIPVVCSTLFALFTNEISILLLLVYLPFLFSISHFGSVRTRFCR